MAVSEPATPRNAAAARDPAASRGAVSRREVALGFLAVLAVSAFAAFRGLERHEYATDEGMWIWVSQKTWPLFRGGAWDDPAWQSLDATWGYVNPPIAKYVLGASLEAQGASWEWKAGTKPPERVLAAARAPSALLGIAGCLGVFWIGLRAFGPGAGVLAGLLLAVSPLWLEVSRRAMTDVHGAGLAILAVCALLPALGELDGRRRARVLVPWVALSGATAGLAVGAKLNAASAPAMLGAVLLIVLLRTVVRPPRAVLPDAARVVALGILFAGASVLAFVGPNPYLHEDAWNRFAGMLAFWKDMCLERAARSAAGGFGNAFYPEEMGARMLAGKFLGPLKAEGLPLLAPLAVAGVASRLRRPGPAAARLAGWLLLVPATLAVAQGPNQVIQPWLPWLGLLGASLVAVSARRPGGAALAGPAMRLLVPVWLAVAGWFVWRMTFLPQSRYYLPLLPVVCVVAGWGLSALRRDLAGSGRAWPARVADVAIVAGVLSVLAAYPDYDASVAKSIAAGPAAARALHWIAVGGLAAAIGGALLPARGARVSAAAAPGPSTS